MSVMTKERTVGRPTILAAFSLCIAIPVVFASCGNAFGTLNKAVSVVVTDVVLDQSTATCPLGGTLQLTATINPSNATNKSVSWSTSDASVATVGSTGLVNGVAVGSCIITVKTADGGYTAKCAVTVTMVAVAGVSLSPTSATVAVGKTKQLSATFTPSAVSDTGLTWSSAETTIAMVDSSGIVTGVAVGTTTITVTTHDGGFTATCEVTVTLHVGVTSISLDASYISLMKGSTQQLITTVAPSNATDTAVIWSSSNTSVATVGSTGLVTGVAAGTAAITATTEDGGYPVSCTFSVYEGVSISPTSATVKVGYTCQLATVIGLSNTSGQTVTWSSSNATVAIVSSSGLVTGVAEGSTSIWLYVNTTYGSYSASITVTVTKAIGSVSIGTENGTSASLSLTGQSAVLALGSTMTVKATCSLEADGYAWYLDGTLVEGATASSLSVGTDLAAGYHSLMSAASVGGILVSASCYFTVQ